METEGKIQVSPRDAILSDDYEYDAARKAADEYIMNTRNPYFADKPDELKIVLERIIMGANVLAERKRMLDWAVARWMEEVDGRPLQNVNRRSLDDTWRQVIRRCGGDDVVLCGPRHDDLVR